ncbi:hypothetical protein [Kitasatospora cheerisanensis]|uniref:Uncharacterized protein n=1 Tax=Kitasatospora cheerisanensis KCTC 2395 TaxID=1348663 RepID=A0A066YYN6_9ACTN|nr:hypothetical protein [Kitasatospora cheerisanensis]KDN86357.1 hypothetical protein KCH_21740 [Kitasatospora cheerisanensis KCTC 2395]
MGIGHLFLYGALALVAVWLVAELLLQNRAALHWRALALAGFLGVVAGMTQSSVPVIVAGAGAFAAGQAMVTMSVKRGRPVGWSLRRADGGLPGPLAKVPLLAAATGGATVAAAAAVAAPKVGEVGPVEVEPVVEEPYAYEEFQELDAGIYADEPVGYQQQQYEQPQQPEQQQYYYQQPDYGYQQQAYQEYQDPYAQQWQQQPQLIGYDQYGQPVYQYPQQQQYAQPYIPQQPGEQQHNGYYQQQY